MAWKFVHKKCGANVFEYLPDHSPEHQIVRAADVRRADGTKVEARAGDVFDERCPGCGAAVSPHGLSWINEQRVGTK